MFCLFCLFCYIFDFKSKFFNMVHKSNQNTNISFFFEKYELINKNIILNNQFKIIFLLISFLIILIVFKIIFLLISSYFSKKNRNYRGKLINVYNNKSHIFNNNNNNSLDQEKLTFTLLLNLINNFKKDSFFLKTKILSFISLNLINVKKRSSLIDKFLKNSNGESINIRKRRRKYYILLLVHFLIFKLSRKELVDSLNLTKKLGNYPFSLSYDEEVISFRKSKYFDYSSFELFFLLFYGLLEWFLVFYILHLGFCIFYDFNIFELSFQFFENFLPLHYKSYKDYIRISLIINLLFFFFFSFYTLHSWIMELTDEVSTYQLPSKDWFVDVFLPALQGIIIIVIFFSIFFLFFYNGWHFLVLLFNYPLQYFYNFTIGLFISLENLILFSVIFDFNIFTQLFLIQKPGIVSEFYSPFFSTNSLLYKNNENRFFNTTNFHNTFFSLNYQNSLELKIIKSELLMDIRKYNRFILEDSKILYSKYLLNKGVRGLGIRLDNHYILQDFDLISNFYPRHFRPNSEQLIDPLISSNLNSQNKNNKIDFTCRSINFNEKKLYSNFSNSYFDKNFVLFNNLKNTVDKKYFIFKKFNQNILFLSNFFFNINFFNKINKFETLYSLDFLDLNNFKLKSKYIYNDIKGLNLKLFEKNNNNKLRFLDTKKNFFHLISFFNNNVFSKLNLSDQKELISLNKQMLNIEKNNENLIFRNSDDFFNYLKKIIYVGLNKEFLENKIFLTEKILNSSNNSKKIYLKKQNKLQTLKNSLSELEKFSLSINFSQNVFNNLKIISNDKKNLFSLVLLNIEFFLLKEKIYNLDYKDSINDLYNFLEEIKKSNKFELNIFSFSLNSDFKYPFLNNFFKPFYYLRRLDYPKFFLRVFETNSRKERINPILLKKEKMFLNDYFFKKLRLLKIFANFPSIISFNTRKNVLYLNNFDEKIKLLSSKIILKNDIIDKIFKYDFSSYYDLEIKIQNFYFFQNTMSERYLHKYFSSTLITENLEVDLNQVSINNKTKLIFVPSQKRQYTRIFQNLNFIDWKIIKDLWLEFPNQDYISYYNQYFSNISTSQNYLKLEFNYSNILFDHETFQLMKGFEKKKYSNKKNFNAKPWFLIDRNLLRSYQFSDYFSSLLLKDYQTTLFYDKQNFLLNNYLYFILKNKVNILLKKHHNFSIKTVFNNYNLIDNDRFSNNSESIFLKNLNLKKKNLFLNHNNLILRLKHNHVCFKNGFYCKHNNNINSLNLSFKYYKNFKNLNHFVFSNNFLFLDQLFDKDYFYHSKYLKYRYKNIDNFKLLDRFKEILKFQIRRFNEFSFLPPRHYMIGWDAIQGDSHLKFLSFTMYWPFNKLLKNIHTHLYSALWSDNMITQPYWLKFLILFSEFVLPNPLYVFVDFLKPLEHQTLTYYYTYGLSRAKIYLIDTDTIYGKSKFEFDQHFFRNYPSTNLNLISYKGIQNYWLSKNFQFFKNYQWNATLLRLISDFDFKSLRFKRGFFYSLSYPDFAFKDEGFYEKIDRDFYFNIVNRNKNYKSLPQGLPLPIIFEDLKTNSLKFSKYIENTFNDNIKFVDFLKYMDPFPHLGSLRKKYTEHQIYIVTKNWHTTALYKYSFVDFSFLGNYFNNFKVFTNSKIGFYDPFGFVHTRGENSFDEDTLYSYNRFVNRVSNIIYYDSNYFHNMHFENSKNKLFQQKIYDSTIKKYLNKKLISNNFFKIIIPYINIEEILQFKNSISFLNLITKNEELSGIFKRINIRLINFIDRIILKDDVNRDQNDLSDFYLFFFKDYFWFLNLRNYVKLRGIDPWNLFSINKNNNIYDSLYYTNKILFTTNKKEQNERLSIWITPYRLNFYGIKNYNILNKDISNRDFKKIISFYTQKENLMQFLEKDLSNLLKQNYEIKLKKNNLNNNDKKSLFYKNKKILFNNPNSRHYFIKSEFFKFYFFKYKFNPYNFNMFNFPYNNQYSNISTKTFYNILIQNQLIGKIKSDRIFGKECLNNQYRFKRLYFLKFFEIYEKSNFESDFSFNIFYKNFKNYFKLVSNKNGTFLPLINHNNLLNIQSLKRIDNEIYTFVRYFNKNEIFLSEFDFLDKIYVKYSALLDLFYIDFGLPFSEWFVNDDWVSKRFKKYGFQLFKTYRTFYKKDERFNLDFISRRHIRKLQSFFIFEKQKQKKRKLLKYYHYRKAHKLFIYKFIPNFFKRRSKQNSSVYKWIFVVNKIKPTPTILIFKNNEIRITKIKNYLLFLKVLGNSLENFSGFLFWNYLLKESNRISFLIGKPNLNFIDLNSSFSYKTQAKLVFINKQINNKYLYFYNSNKTFFSFYRINYFYNKNNLFLFDLKKCSLLTGFEKFNKYNFHIKNYLLDNYQTKKINQFKYLSRFLILKENQKSHLNFYTPQEYLIFFNNKWSTWLRLNKFRKIEDHYIQYNIASNKPLNFKNYHNLLSKENNDFNILLYPYKKFDKFSLKSFLPHSFRNPKKYYIPYNHQLWYFSNLKLTYPLNINFLKFYSIYNDSYDLIRYQTLKVLKQKINFNLFQIQKLYLINDLMYKLNFNEKNLILLSNDYYLKNFSIEFFIYYIKIYLNFCYFCILKLIYLPLNIKLNYSFNIFDLFLLTFDKFPILGVFIKFFIKFIILIFYFFINIFKTIFFSFFFNFLNLLLADFKEFYNLLIKNYFNPFWIFFFYFFWILYYFFLSIFSVYDRETYNVKNIMAQLDWDYEEHEFNRSRRKFDTKSFEQFMRPTHLRFLKNMKEFEERDKTPTIDVIEKLNKVSFQNDFLNKNFIGKIFDKGHWFTKKFPEYENFKNTLFDENLSRQDSSYIQNYLSRPISLSVVANYLKQNYLYKANYMFNKNVQQRFRLKSYPDLMLKDTFRHSDDATEFGRYRWFYNATLFYLQFLFVIFLSSFFFF